MQADRPFHGTIMMLMNTMQDSSNLFLVQEHMNGSYHAVYP